MGSLPLPCFDSGGVTRVSGRGEKEIGAVELETDKFDFEEGNNNDKENILMNKPTKNDWVCIANNECQATNRRGGLYCRMCGTAYKESYVKLKQIQEKEREALQVMMKERQAVNAGKAALVVVGGYLAVNALTSTWKIVNGIVEAPRAIYDKLGESILGQTNYDQLKQDGDIAPSTAFVIFCGAFYASQCATCRWCYLSVRKNGYICTASHHTIAKATAVADYGR